MSDLKRQIKTWLKIEGKNRVWLAEKTHSKKATIDRWLAVGGSIPLAKQDLILQLMKETREGNRSEQNISSKWKPFALLFTQEEYRLLERAARLDGMDVRSWCEKELIKSAKTKEERRGFLVADDGDEYKTGPR